MFDTDSRLSKRYRLQRPGLAFIAGFPTLSVDGSLENEGIIIPKCDLRIFQQVVGCERYYGSRKACFHTMLVVNENPTTSTHMRVLEAKVLVVCEIMQRGWRLPAV